MRLGRGIVVSIAAAALLAPGPASAAPSSARVVPCEMRLQPPAPVPAVGASGRPAVEPLLPRYGTSYDADPLLAPALRLYRQWQWKPLYTALDDLTRSHPDHLDTYRVQADVYLVNGSFAAALSQLDQVLRRDPRDVHALLVTALIQTFQAETMDAACRLTHLRRASPTQHQRLVAFLQATDHDLNDVTPHPAPTIAPDAIVVFGRPAGHDGTVPPALRERLDAALTLAQRYPTASVLVSGGPVRNEYAEADVMAAWLAAQGVAESRIVRDVRARDTVGNVLAMVGEGKARGWTRVVAVTSQPHLRRAVSTLRAAARDQNWDVVVEAIGTGAPPAAAGLAHERKYTFVTAARAAHLYEKGDVRQR